MKKKAFLLQNACIILLLLLAAQPSFSQNIFKVTGKITDDTGKPVDGATVQVKGTATATVAKADGTFEVNVPSGNSTLIVSYVGYLEQEIPLSGKTEVSLSLSPLANSLQDVVVVGYGTRKRVEVTGATTSISGENLRSVQT
ncbi:MAG TPA: carboxypeptidase-like regulatory domain-containing protein, partial [Chitinophagaceae bacterium]|nr:carboxypeptidase-like regulatory domain-containing protein [Chitinophagaceae bacterium]